MKKLTLFFLSLLACGLAFQACDNTKTYAEMLEDEKDAIKAFIRDSSITVISQTEFYRNDSTTDVNKNEYHLPVSIFILLLLCADFVPMSCRRWRALMDVR